MVKGTTIRCSVTQEQDNKTPNVESRTIHLKPTNQDDPEKAKMSMKFTESGERTLKNLIGKNLELTDVIEVNIKVTNQQAKIDGDDDLGK